MYCLFCHNKGYVPCSCHNGKTHEIRGTNFFGDSVVRIVKTCKKCNGFGNLSCLRCKTSFYGEMTVRYDVLSATKVTC